MQMGLLIILYVAVAYKGISLFNTFIIKNMVKDSTKQQTAAVLPSESNSFFKPSIIVFISR